MLVETAHSGGHYAATNATSSGGGIYQDVAVNAGATSYSGLGNLGNWTQAQTCVEATGSHSSLRIQLYPAPGSPTTEVDDVNVNVSLAANGGFEDGSGPWAPYPGTRSNYVVYANAPGAPPAYSGTHFAATNTSSSGGGLIQDIPLNTSAGQTICGSAELRTEYPGTGAAGTFALWLTGGAAHESGSSSYSGLGNGANWSPVGACVEATGSHTNLRVQFYPKPGAPTVEIDDVNVNDSLAANGGFEDGGAPWAIYPGTRSNYRIYANGQVTETVAPPPPPPVQPTPQPTPIPTPRARHALKVKLLMTWSWRFAVTTLRLTRIGRFPHSTRLTVTCKGRGCGRPANRSAAGPKGVHRLLKRLAGHRYRAGDVVTITFTARGWKPERARIVIRDGRLPRVSRV